VIKLWNLKTGTCEKTFLGHQKGIACIQFDGKTIVSGSSDQTIRVFDRDTQAEIATLRGHDSLVRTVQATKNKIVSGSYDESVRIWRREEDTGNWIPGPVLRQAITPLPTASAAGNANNHTQLQMAALQQFQANAASTNPGTVQMHQVQVAGAGLAGAIAAAQLLPNHPQQQQQQQQQPAIPQQQQATAAAAVAAAVVNTPAAAQAGGAHRVFKLQFDARWIICCSQDTRIVGWDYAADDDGVIEASRFFLGG
jgi:F-box and WD-40 domain protein 1/11